MFSCLLLEFLLVGSFVLACPSRGLCFCPREPRAGSGPAYPCGSQSRFLRAFIPKVGPKASCASSKPAGLEWAWLDSICAFFWGHQLDYCPSTLGRCVEGGAFSRLPPELETGYLGKDRQARKTDDAVCSAPPRKPRRARERRCPSIWKARTRLTFYGSLCLSSCRVASALHPFACPLVTKQTKGRP